MVTVLHKVYVHKKTTLRGLLIFSTGMHIRLIIGKLFARFLRKYNRYVAIVR
ncbi:hypothetical protein ECOT7509_1308 [Escherichia coli TW07509]|nr:hypothetical protein ECOT7509_1308 [Escherichia coli TW07509]